MRHIPLQSHCPVPAGLKRLLLIRPTTIKIDQNLITRRLKKNADNLDLRKRRKCKSSRKRWGSIHGTPVCKSFNCFDHPFLLPRTAIQIYIPYLVESRGTVKSTTSARTPLIPNASTATWTCLSTIILIMPFVVPFLSTEPLAPSAG